MLLRRLEQAQDSGTQLELPSFCIFILIPSIFVVLSLLPLSHLSDMSGNSTSQMYTSNMLVSSLMSQPDSHYHTLGWNRLGRIPTTSFASELPFCPFSTPTLEGIDPLKA